jgi:hypothetical protein
MQWKKNDVINKEQKLRKSWIPDRDYDSWKIPYFNQQNAQIKYNKTDHKTRFIFKNKGSYVQQVFQVLVALTFVI